MAQRDVKEETELQVPEALAPCANNCGFQGNPATNNLCQNCFLASKNKAATPSPPSPTSPSSSLSPVRRPEFVKPRSDPVVAAPDPAVTAPVRLVNRCFSCRKRVGLTGFRCRCGELYCGDHRYSDRHECSYDYRAAGRDEIARNNPVVRAAKIVRF